MSSCRSCGADLDKPVGVCPTCHSPQHPDGTAFGQAETKLRGWKLAVDADKLAPEVLRARIGELQVVDRHRQRWWLDADGVWNRWEQEGWQPADPSPRLLTRSTGRRRWWVAAGCAVGVLALLGLTAIFLFAGWQESRSSPVLVEGMDPPSASADHVPLSPDQQKVLGELGSPQAFSLLFYDQPDVRGEQMLVRQETWMYYSEKVVIAFENGAEVGRDPLEVGLDGPLGELKVRPQDFSAYMNLEDVLEAAALSSYLAVPLEEAYLRAASVYYGDGLTFGLVRGELRYLEALAILEGEGG
jgi:hypothetical protein